MRQTTGQISRFGTLKTLLQRFAFLSLIGITFALMLIGAPIQWPKDFPAEMFPTKLVAQHADLIARIAARPAKRASEPSSSSIRNNWLYLQTRSVRLADPVLI